MKIFVFLKRPITDTKYLNKNSASYRTKNSDSNDTKNIESSGVLERKVYVKSFWKHEVCTRHFEISGKCLISVLSRSMTNGLRNQTIGYQTIFYDAKKVLKKINY